MPQTEENTGLRGKEVAITGRLASMNRDEARARIDEAGGSYVRTPGEATELLVVGQWGPPIGEDGRLTRSMRAAEEVKRRGGKIRVIDEADFLARLGLTERLDDLHREYTTSQLARILRIEPALVRHWVRRGLIRPRREVGYLYYFDFQQVATARTLSRLTREGVSPGVIRRSLETLRGWMNVDPAFSLLETMDRFGNLLVRTEDGHLAEPNGQLRMEFDDGGDVPATAPVGAPQERTVEQWFELGVHAEREGLLPVAVGHYQRALALNDAHPEVHFNLGNALYGMGQVKESLASYRAAVHAAPTFVEAWNNMGILLDEMGDEENAIVAYRRALSIAPDYADAHYNLAESFVKCGKVDEAREHWRAYLRADPLSPFARVVRERLARL